MATRRSAREVCVKMHAGATRPCPATVPARAVPVRRITRIEGVQAMGPLRPGGAGQIHYYHDFAPGTGPVLARDLSRSRNNGVLVGGRYTLTDEGMIEDNPMRHHHRHSHRNPAHGTLMFLTLTGLALGFVAIIANIVKSLAPQRWSARAHKIAGYGLDAVLVVAGAALYRKSPIWGIALAGAGVAEAVQSAYVDLGLDAKIQSMLHRSPGTSAGVSGALPEGTRERVHAGGWRVRERAAA